MAALGSSSSVQVNEGTSANLKAIVGKGGVRPGEAEARPSIGLTDGRTDDGRRTDGRKNLDEKIWPKKK